MAIEVSNLFVTLAGKALDPAVGIKVARLSGEGDFCLFGAEIGARTKLSAHFHREGPELYYILSGKGRMSLGEPVGEAGVTWKEVFEVAAGDCFTVAPGQVHQLENPGETPLNALLGCSAQHLTTDRIVLGTPQ
ncbi:MAG TPA: cupin domain-containing protein [Holophaga sp.]|nr:cupin domain-containing protein [Holophaga sp.]